MRCRWIQPIAILEQADTKNKTFQFKALIGQKDKSGIVFNLGEVEEATRLHVASAMEKKKG